VGRIKSVRKNKLKMFLNSLWLWSWYRALRFVLRRVGPTSALACANRFERTYAFGPVEVRVVERDTREPDGYSREELCQMLWLVRSEEASQGWRVPEPRVGEIS
jgi:hypothetical protein